MFGSRIRRPEIGEEIVGLAVAEGGEAVELDLG